MPKWPPERILGKRLVERPLALMDEGKLSPGATQLFVASLLCADESGALSPEAMARAGRLVEASTITVRPFEEDSDYVRIRFVPNADPTIVPKKRKRR